MSTTPAQASAAEYMSTYHVPEILEDAVAACGRYRPENPFAYIANFIRIRNTTVTKVQATSAVSSNGTVCLQVDVYANVDGVEKKLGTGIAAPGMGVRPIVLDPKIPTLGRDQQEAFEMVDGELVDPNADPTVRVFHIPRGVDKTVEWINEELTDRLVGVSPLDQIAVDQLLCELDGTEKKFNAGANVLNAISIAMAEAACNIKGIPLYEHLAEASRAHGDFQKQFSIPVPIVTVLTGGEDIYAGPMRPDLPAVPNMQAKEIHIIPNTKLTCPAQIEQVLKINRSLKKVILAKFGKEGSQVNSTGAYQAPHKTISEALMTVREACIDAVGIEEASHVGMGLDMQARTFYMPTEDTYLVQGKVLNTTELMTFYTDLKVEFPELSYLEDPFAAADIVGWKSACRQFGFAPIVVADELYHSSPRMTIAGTLEKMATGACIKTSAIGTLSEAMQSARAMHESDYRSIISRRKAEGTAVNVDIGVALGSWGIKVGCVAGIDSGAGAFSRMLEIYEETTTFPEDGHHYVRNDWYSMVYDDVTLPPDASTPGTQLLAMKEAEATGVLKFHGSFTSRMDRLWDSAFDFLHANPSVTELDLSHNRIWEAGQKELFQRLPSSIKLINLSNNQIDVLVAEVGLCANLKVLDLSNNNMESLPPALSKLNDTTMETTMLDELCIQGNPLKDVLLNGMPAGMSCERGAGDATSVTANAYTSFQADPGYKMVVANLKKLIRDQARLDAPGAKVPVHFSACLSEVTNQGPIKGRLLEVLMEFLAGEAKWSGYHPTSRNDYGNRIDAF